MSGLLDIGEPGYGFTRKNELNSENSNLSQELPEQPTRVPITQPGFCIFLVFPFNSQRT